MCVSDIRAFGGAVAQARCAHPPLEKAAFDLIAAAEALVEDWAARRPVSGTALVLAVRAFQQRRRQLQGRVVLTSAGTVPLRRPR